MKLSNIKGIVIFAVLGSMASVSVASDAGHGAAAAPACTAFGPQHLEILIIIKAQINNHFHLLQNQKI